MKWMVDQLKEMTLAQALLCGVSVRVVWVDSNQSSLSYAIFWMDILSPYGDDMEFIKYVVQYNGVGCHVVYAPWWGEVSNT